MTHGTSHTVRAISDDTDHYTPGHTVLDHISGYATGHTADSIGADSRSEPADDPAIGQIGSYTMVDSTPGHTAHSLPNQDKTSPSDPADDPAIGQIGSYTVVDSTRGRTNTPSDSAPTPSASDRRSVTKGFSNYPDLDGKKITELFLARICYTIRFVDIQRLGECLNFSPAKVQQIQMDNPYMPDQMFGIILKWHKQYPDNTVLDLIRAIHVLNIPNFQSIVQRFI